MVDSEPDEAETDLDRVCSWRIQGGAAPSADALRREDCGTHALRRTKTALIYKQTGNLGAVQILLGHTKIESTARHLGVDVEDAL